MGILASIFDITKKAIVAILPEKVMEKLSSSFENPLVGLAAFSALVIASLFVPLPGSTLGLLLMGAPFFLNKKTASAIKDQVATALGLENKTQTGSTAESETEDDSSKTENEELTEQGNTGARMDSSENKLDESLDQSPHVTRPVSSYPIIKAAAARNTLVLPISALTQTQQVSPVPTPINATTDLLGSKPSPAPATSVQYTNTAQLPLSDNISLAFSLALGAGLSASVAHVLKEESIKQQAQKSDSAMESPKQSEPEAEARLETTESGAKAEPKPLLNMAGLDPKFASKFKAENKHIFDEPTPSAKAQNESEYESVFEQLFAKTPAPKPVPENKEEAHSDDFVLEAASKAVEEAFHATRGKDLFIQSPLVFFPKPRLPVAEPVAPAADPTLKGIAPPAAVVTSNGLI